MNEIVLRTRQSFCIVTIFFGGIIHSSFAQTFTRVGGVGTDFYDANNWDDANSRADQDESEWPFS